MEKFIEMISDKIENEDKDKKRKIRWKRDGKPYVCMIFIKFT